MPESWGCCPNILVPAQPLPRRGPSSRPRWAAKGSWLVGGSSAVECWTFLVCLPAHSSASGTGTFPTMPCSGMAAPLLGTFQLGATWEGHVRGARVGWAETRSSSALSCCQTFSSSPCSTPLLDASWLQMSREEEEVVDSIQILASNLSQVTVASWMMTVPASAGRGSAAGLLEVSWLDRAAASRWCCPSQLQSCWLAVPTSHALCLSICPLTARM